MSGQRRFSVVVGSVLTTALVAVLATVLATVFVPAPCAWAGRNVFAVEGERVLMNGRPFKVVGLRLSNALISDEETRELIDNLDTYRSYGVNTVSAFLMGSRFGDVKGFAADASLNPTHAARLARIIEAADARGMIVLVGCLYWSTSRANDDLGAWTQRDANLAVANAVRWLSGNGYRNVFVDPDNEGMAHDATGWSIGQMIDAGHAVDRTIMIAYNDSAAPPASADLLIHHSPKAPGRPWIESEGAAPNAAGGYWGSYSKEDGYYNYVRIGRYTAAMKAAQIDAARRTIASNSGYMMASTWLQAAPFEGIGGPFMQPGGLSNISDVDADMKRLHADAGVRWWLEAMRASYGAWTAPNASTPAADAGASADARSGVLADAGTGAVDARSGGRVPDASGGGPAAADGATHAEVGRGIEDADAGAADRAPSSSTPSRAADARPPTPGNEADGGPPAANRDSPGPGCGCNVSAAHSEAPLTAPFIAVGMLAWVLLNRRRGQRRGR